ncbi:MAG: PepSY-associated TM helix domain-containing protein [Rhodanobacter sp.]
MRGRPRQCLQQLHLWLGLSVGLVFALIALSGTFVTYQKAWLRVAYPQLAAHALPDASQRAAVLGRIATQWQGRDLRSADLPLAALPVWQLYFADGTRRYLDPADGKLLLTRTPDGDLLALVYDWHIHLLAGERGEQVLGVLGWLMLFLLLSGPLLWWPGRRQVATSLHLHAQPPTRRWLSWHRSLGVLSLPLIVVVSLTGTLMIYSTGTGRLLGTVFADAPAAKPPAAIAWRAAPINWASVLAAAQRALPDAELHRVTLPNTANGQVIIRARARGEWHQVGRSRIWLDPWRAIVLDSNDATSDGRGTRLNNAVYPLHSGGVGGWAWQLGVAVAGLLPLFFLVTGFLFWRARQRR